VDTISREYEMTARQAALKFGPDALSDPMKADLANTKSYRKFTVVHMIYPRGPGEVEQGKKDGPNKPFASIYLDKASKHVLLSSGFDEQPFFVTRYLKWKNSECYGYSPSWTALPEARQLNFLEKQLDSLAELSAFPRVLIPAGFDQDIDLRAAGITYFDPNNPNALPKEWGTTGRYDIDALDDVIVAAGRRGGSRIEVHSGRASGGVLARQAAFAALATAATEPPGPRREGDAAAAAGPAMLGADGLTVVSEAPLIGGLPPARRMSKFCVKAGPWPRWRK
jgi:hypothetical protein